MMEAETGVMLLEARGARVPGSQQHQEEAREDFSLEASEGAQPSQHLHFRLLAFRTVRKQTPDWAAKFLPIGYSTHRNLIHTSLDALKHWSLLNRNKNLKKQHGFFSRTNNFAFSSFNQQNWPVLLR